MTIIGNSRCAICQTTNKQKKQKVCDECSFINEFVTKWGRENLRAILTNHLTQQRSGSMNNLCDEKNEKIKQEQPITNITLTRELSQQCRNDSCSCHSRKSFSCPSAPPYQPN